MIVSGKVMYADSTAAEGVILYFYHTDSTGEYRPGDTQTIAKRHGAIRGWIKTNKKGEYRIYTNRPASYPNTNAPAHIHPVVKEPDANEYYIDEYLFADDAFVTIDIRQRAADRGGSGICTVTTKNGIQYCERNIILGANIPGYPARVE